MMQRFMTLVVTTLTNGAGFKSARPFFKLSNNGQANGTTPLVAGGASIPPESALGACMIHRGVGTRCPPRVPLAWSPERPTGPISHGMKRKFNNDPTQGWKPDDNRDAVSC
jgi:hypothetical protein